MPRNGPNKQKCYTPKPTLVKFMAQKIRIEKKKNRTELFNEATQTDLFKREIRNSDTKKSRILDKLVFPSMANITFFFQCIAEYPELQPVFADDIKELLGINRNKPTFNHYAFIFSALVNSILRWDTVHNKDPIRGKNNFRVNLMDVLQTILLSHFQENTIELKVPDAIRSLAREDMYRASGWVHMLKNSIGDQAENDLRPDIELLKEAKEDLVQLNKGNANDSERIAILTEKYHSDIEDHDSYVEKIIPTRTLEWKIKDILKA